MNFEIYYLLRSKQDGNYLAARPNPDDTSRYLLLFGDRAEALSYLNTHGGDVIEKFAIESVPAQQVKGVLERWDMQGIGLVRDPLIPQVEFMVRDDK